MTARFVICLLLLLPAVLRADPPAEAPHVPKKFDFIRSIEIEGGAMMRSYNRRGAQFFRVETRYLDPDVNAFVGLVAFVTRFNDDIRLGDPNNPSLSPAIWNWGAAVGMIRGRHLWAVDLMGTNLSERLGFGPALVGEHTLGKGFLIFHRTAVDIYVGDTILDSDHGLMWRPRESFGVSIGYRVFAAGHFNRNGPRASLRLRFNVPKLPFIFPSIG